MYHNSAMANIASVLKSEIARLARREIKAEITPLKKAASQYRSSIAALKRQIQDLEKQLRRKSRSAPAADSAEEGGEEVVLPPYLRTRPIRNIAAAARCQPDAVVQLDAA
jgi:predicted lysophospholipase L1 biosynthesis ABC-type transport system permease subunit